MNKALVPWLLLVAVLFTVIELTLLRGVPARCVPGKQEDCSCFVPTEAGYQVCLGDRYTECRCQNVGPQVVFR